MRSHELTFLKELLSQPTAPFREWHVISAVKRYLSSRHVPFFQDPIGNIIVGVASKSEYRELVLSTSKEPVRFFVAHMDHPGFHGTMWGRDGRLRVIWHGGSPTKHLEGAAVWLANSQGLMGEGELTRVKLNRHGSAIATAEVRLRFPLDRPAKAKSLFGAFRFHEPVWKRGRVLYTKAADDLVGVFAIVSLAIHFSRNANGRTNVPFLGLLSRAEEVGFIGTIGHFQLGWLHRARRPVWFVSLETSRTLPGALIGKGPVVRLGDRATVFDAGGIERLSTLASCVLPGKFQRRIMDGGTCEATVAVALGYRAIGISVPLGNYHNQSFEGGPESRGKLGPAPEFVHLDDVEGMLNLCHALMEKEVLSAPPWLAKTTAFRRLWKQYRPLLDFPT